MTRGSFAAASQLAVRAAVAAGLSVIVGRLLQIERPINALMTAILVIDLSPQDTRKLSIPRFAGTALGAAIGAALTGVIPPNSWWIALGVLATMLLSNLLRLKGAERLAGFIFGIVLLDQSDAPWKDAGRRIIETTLGIAMAVLVSFVPKLLKVEAPADGGEQGQA